VKRRHVIWILVPVLICMSVYLARRNSRSLWILSGLSPVLECPEVLELGERELGEVAMSRFTIANRGRGQLEITDVETSCSCTGLEQEREGKLVRVESLRLSAGEKAELMMRVAVQGTPGIPSRNGIRFRTNDPSREEVTIEASVSKVKAGVTTIPTSAIFGTLFIGAKNHQVLDVYDSTVPPRSMARVASLRPEQFSVRMLPVLEGTESLIDPRLGVRIGRLEITAITSTPGTLTGEVEIQLKNEQRAPTLIEVSGRVAGPVEISPSVLVLPRTAEAGPVYFGECICRSTDGKAFTLTADSPPDGLRVQIEPQGSGPSQTVRIGWDPAKVVERPSLGLPKVRLRANIEGTETILEVGVFCRKRGAS
jgi:Protein of unknown function (DUF1573)